MKIRLKLIAENLKDLFSFFAKKQVFILVVGLVCYFFVPQILPDNYEGSKQYFITVGITIIEIQSKKINTEDLIWHTFLWMKAEI